MPVWSLSERELHGHLQTLKAALETTSSPRVQGHQWHTKILSALLQCAKGRPGYITQNAAIPVDHLQPDLIIGSGFGDLVVSVPWRLERSFALKMAKYKPLVTAGRASHILPVVIGTDGSIHQESATGLAYAGVDVPRFLQEAALAILWHYSQS